MSKAKPVRKVNKKVLLGKLHLLGFHTYTELGKVLTPVRTRFMVCQIVNNPDDHPEDASQIAKVLETNIATLFPKVTE